MIARNRKEATHCLIVTCERGSRHANKLKCLEGSTCLSLSSGNDLLKLVNEGWYPDSLCCLDKELDNSVAEQLYELVVNHKCESFLFHQNILNSYGDLREYKTVYFLCGLTPGPRNAKSCAEVGIPHYPSSFFLSQEPQVFSPATHAIRFGLFLGFRRIGLVGADPVPQIPHTTDVLDSFRALVRDSANFDVRPQISVCDKESMLVAEQVFPYIDPDRFVSGRYLSALMIPFTRRDLRLLEERFCSWGTETFAPYIMPTPHPSVSLGLCFNGGQDKLLEEEIRNVFKANRLSRYFFGLRFFYSNLSGLRDLYSTTFEERPGPEGFFAGPNNQFIDIIQTFSLGMAHIMLMEADVAPLRSGWLERVEQISSGTDRFWVCGSQYRGVGGISSFRHINGNAIYNVGDPEFQEFLKEEYLPFFARAVKKNPKLAYDVMTHGYCDPAFNQELLDSTSAQDARQECLSNFKHHAHRFRFSDFIVNISHPDDRKPRDLISWHLAIAKFPESVLFHGATQKIDHFIRWRAHDDKQAKRVSDEQLSLVDSREQYLVGHSMISHGAHPPVTLVEVFDDCVSMLDQAEFDDIEREANATEPVRSLLDQCREFTERMPTEAEPIRTIHHFTCTGGTLISKCLACMPNTQLLSEVDPFSRIRLATEKNQVHPTDLIRLVRASSRGSNIALEAELFLAGIKVLYQDSMRKGLRLILRDHIHSKYCYEAGLFEVPSLRDLVRTAYSVRSIVTVRHPLDSFLSLANTGQVHFQPPTIDEYCSRYLCFLDDYGGVSLFKYEDFVESPEGEMRHMCEALDLPFVEGFEDLFRVHALSGDRGRSSGRINRLAKLPVSESLESELAQSETYIELCQRLGYGMTSVT